MHKLIPYIDTTLLKPEAGLLETQDFIDTHRTLIQSTAGFCTWYPLFSELVLPENTRKIAVAGGFPFSRNSFTAQLFEMEEALTLGVHEIDITLNHGLIQEGNLNIVSQQIREARDITTGIVLKVILETGSLSQEQTTLLSEFCLEHSVDFIKTSSGMRGEGASLDAASTILETMKANNTYTGIKISGGVRSEETANAYFDLASTYFNKVTPDNFRIGSSSLAQVLEET